MCWICQRANKLEENETPIRWFHYLNRLLFIVAILAGITWILSKI